MEAPLLPGHSWLPVSVFSSLLRVINLFHTAHEVFSSFYVLYINRAQHHFFLSRNIHAISFIFTIMRLLEFLSWGRILIKNMEAEKVPFQRPYFLLGFGLWPAVWYNHRDWEYIEDNPTSRCPPYILPNHLIQVLFWHIFLTRSSFFLGNSLQTSVVLSFKASVPYKQTETKELMNKYVAVGP